MKRNLLYSLMALCICLFAACSQEEIISEAGQNGKTVNMTVGVPGGATTRAMPSVEGKILRCIMQVVDKDNKAIPGEGMRQTLEIKTDKVTFTFKAPEGDYKCLFWADFVTAIATDNIYTTTDLTNITYKATGNDVFSTAADAFCGYVSNGTTTIQLKRPFAKVSVTPNSAGNYAGYNKLTVSYDAPSGFNMVTKTVSSTPKKVTYTNTAFKAADGPWFTSYLFAPSNMSKLDSDITMKLEGASGVETKTLTIGADKVPLTENFEINGKFDAAEGNNVDVEVGFDNEFDKPGSKAPVVGDYFYADGTWGAAASNGNGSPAVGVVFHVESESTQLDNVANYTGVTFTDNKIRGWVVAAGTISGKVFLAKDATAALPDGLGSTATDYMGFANTNLWNAGNTDVETYPAVKAALDYNTTVSVSTETFKNSGWYLPSAGQMTTLLAVYAENNSNAQGAAFIVQTKLQALVDAQKGDLMGDGYHWASTGALSSGAVAAFRVGFHKTANYGKSGANSGLTSGSFVRPVLTF